MSKKSKRAQLNNRLENLFDEIEENAAPKGLAIEAQTNGWVWEADSQAVVTACSPEITRHLGLDPAAHIGQKIDRLGQSKAEQTRLRNAIKQGKFPTQVELSAKNPAGESIRIVFHILTNLGPKGEISGYHGFTEVRPVSEEPAPTATPAKTSASKPGQAPARVRKPAVKPKPAKAKPARTKPAPAIEPTAEAITQPEAIETPQAEPIAEPESAPAAHAPEPDVAEPTGTPAPHSPSPVAFQTDTDGLLSLIDDNPERLWSEDERLLVQQVADQLALAMENANLFQQTQAALSETDALYQASAELNAAQDYASVLQVLLSHTLLGQNTTLLSINVFEAPWNNPAQPPAWSETLQHWTPATGLSSEPSRIRFNLHNLLQRDHYTYIQDVNADSRIPPQARAFFNVENNARSAVFIPVISGADWLGYIQAFFGARQEFSEEAVRRLSSVAGQSTEKITSIYLNNRILRRRTNADRLNTLARQMAELLSEQDLRRFMLSQIFDYLQPDQVSLYVLDEEATQVQLIERTLAVPDASEDDYQIGQWLPLTERTDLNQSLQERQPIYDAQIMARGLVREHYRLPWFIGEQIRGLIEVFHTARSAVISDLDQEFIEGLTLQAASAMERARLFEQTQAALSLTDEQARRLRILNELSAQLPAAALLQDVYDLTIAKTHEIFPSERVSLTLLTAGRDAVEVAAVLGGEGQLEVGARLPLAGTANETVINENRILANPDTGHIAPEAIRSYIVGPLLVAGEVIGTLNVGSRQPHFFESRDQDILQQLLSLVGAVVENRRLFEGIQDALATTEEQARRLSRLNQMSAQLGQSISVEPMYRIAVERAREIFDADHANLALLDEGEAQIVAVSGATAGQQLGSRLELAGPLRQAVIEASIIVDEAPDPNDPTSSPSTRMVAPLTASGQVFGALNLSARRPGAFTPRDQDFMLQVSTLLSSTLENQRLFSQIQRRSQQLEASAEVSRVASTILDITQLLPQVVNLIKNGFDLYYCGLFLVDDTGEWTGEPNRWAVLQAGTGEAGRQMLMNGHKLEIGGTSMVGTAVAASQARIALDVGREAAFFRNPYLPETRSEMALPLISRGAVLGALTIQSELEAAFTQEDITSLQTMSDLIANIIENTRLFSQTEERAEELTLLNEMARAFTQTLDVDTVIESTFHYTGKLMDADNFYLGFYHPAENEIEFKLFTEDGRRIPPPEERFKLGAGLTDRIVTTRAPLLIEEDVETYLRGLGLEPRGRPAQCWLGVPMLQGEEVIGVIAVQSYHAPREYSRRHMDLLSAVANQATVAINNARLFQQTQARARREALLREITARVHASADPDTILRTAVREVSTALGRDTFIQLQPRAETGAGAVLRPTRSGNGSGNGHANGDSPKNEDPQ